MFFLKQAFFRHILRLDSNSEFLDHILCLHLDLPSSTDYFISFAEQPISANKVVTRLGAKIKKSTVIEFVTVIRFYFPPCIEDRTAHVQRRLDFIPTVFQASLLFLLRARAHETYRMQLVVVANLPTLEAGFAVDHVFNAENRRGELKALVLELCR